jgi:hypothetical protein
MNSRAKRILAGLAALLVAAFLWLPALHFLFARPASAFHPAQGLSTKARQLAARHLQLWIDPQLREQELRRMRASNAEWDFMGRSFLVWSLANMGLREPASKPLYLQTIDQIIDETLRLEKEKGIFFFLMPYAHVRPFISQPPHSLFLDGEIALMLASRRVLEEKPEYKPLLTERVDAIVQRFKESPHLVLESYPDECWTFDHIIALDAIRLADRLDGSDHSGLLREWLAMARKKLVHQESGLLLSTFSTDLQPLIGPEGSTLWMVAHGLQLLDEDFARDQYDRTRNQLGEITLGFGYAHEWPPSWKGEADIDSGPIIPVFDISAGSSGMALIGAAAFDDQRFLSSLAATLDFAAFPTRQGGRLKYCASNQVGDAALLYAATLGPLWEHVKTSKRATRADMRSLPMNRSSLDALPTIPPLPFGRGEGRGEGSVRSWLVQGTNARKFSGSSLPIGYLVSALQSQRDCVLQPRVALAAPKSEGGGRNELPWVEGRTLLNPERVPATALNTYPEDGERMLRNISRLEPPWQRQRRAVRLACHSLGIRSLRWDRPDTLPYVGVHGEGELSPARPKATDAGIASRLPNHSPSPGGEGRGEGEPPVRRLIFSS